MLGGYLLKEGGVMGLAGTFPATHPETPLSLGFPPLAFPSSQPPPRPSIADVQGTGRQEKGALFQAQHWAVFALSLI